MKDVRDFPKSLTMLQVTDTSLYIVTAVVIYRYAGSNVTSPALASAGPLMSKVAYGLAIPTVRGLPPFPTPAYSFAGRLSLPVSSSVTSRANISMFASSVARTTCTATASLLLELG